MHYFEFLKTLNLDKTPLTDKEAVLITDTMLLSTKPFNAPFKRLLNQIGQLTKHQKINCFISYAWASQDLFPEELWTQELTYRLADWLRLAGINVFIDKENSRFGNQMKPFMEQHVQNDDYIILIGTKTLKAKITSSIFYNVQIEFGQIKNRIQSESTNPNQASIIPLIVSGKNEEALPDGLLGKIAVEDFSGNGLLSSQANVLIDSLQGLIAKLYSLNCQNPNLSLIKTYKNLWKTFQQEVLSRGNQLGNLTINSHLYLKQAQSRQKYFGKTNYHFFPALPVNASNQHIGSTRILNEIMDSILQQPTPTNTQVTVISGLGGMGKTHLAKQVMLSVKNGCKFAIWADIESQITTNLYQKELEQLGFTVEQLPYNEQLQLLFEWLGDHPGWLLILDDVKDYQQIQSYLPPHGGHVLITSRYGEWPIEYLHHSLKELPLDESRGLIKRHVNKRSFSDEAINKLAIKLECLPLALVQAAAYLANNPAITIDYYLKLYEKEPGELLKIYTTHKNVWQTLGISLEQVQAASVEAGSLLHKCAIFGHNPLPLTLLAKWANCSKIKLNTLLAPSLNYYLVQPHMEENTVILHPVVSDILYAKLEDNTKKEIIEEGLFFISKQLETRKASYNFILINYLLEMLQKIKKLEKCSKPINPIILANALLAAFPFLLKQDMMSVLALIYPQWLALLEDKTILKEALIQYQLLSQLLYFYTKKRERHEFEFIEKKYNQLPIAQLSKEIQVNILVAKGVIAIELEHYEQAITYLEEAIKEKILNPYEQARAYANCCTAYIQANQNTQAIKMAEEGLNILNSTQQDDGIIILRTYIKANLAEMYINANELDKAEKLRYENISDSKNWHSVNGSRGASWNYFSLAKIACRKGKYELATQHYGIFMSEMNKVFGNLNKWPEKYQKTAKELDKEITQKQEHPDKACTPSRIRPGATYASF